MFKIPTCSGGVRPPCTFVTVLLSAVLAIAVGSMSSSAWAAPPDMPPGLEKKLMDQAISNGSVRVIVGLKLPGRPFDLEGKLPDKAAVNQQRAGIANAAAALRGEMQSFQARVNREYVTLPYMALSVNANALEHLLRSPRIISIEEDVARDHFNASATPFVGADSTWEAGFGGKGAAVAILDTGVDNDHPFFLGGGPDGEILRIVDEACFSTPGDASLCPNSDPEYGPGSADPTVPNCFNATGDNICTHGTHVAGIAAGQDDPLDPNNNFNGIAPEAGIVAVQVFHRVNDCDDDEAGDQPCARTWESDYVAGLDWVQWFALPRHNVASANMSLGGGVYNAPCAGTPSDVAMASLRSVGVATAVSAGNAGWTWLIGGPGCAPNAVTVGVASDGDYGSGTPWVQTVWPYDVWFNMSKDVDITASGLDMDSSVPDDDYDSKGGTSMAAPQVAGAFAVLKAIDPSMSVDDAEQLLKDTGLLVMDQRDANPVQGDDDYNEVCGGNEASPACQPYTRIVKPLLQLNAAVAAITESDLGIYKDCKPDGDKLVGEQALCFLTVTNYGDDAAMEVEVTDTYVSDGSADFTLGTPTIDPPDAGNCEVSDNPQNPSGWVTCDLGGMLAGEVVYITIPVNTDDPLNIDDNATVNALTPDPFLLNNASSDGLVFYEGADLAVTKDCKPDGDLWAGEEGICTIIVNNFGPSDAENVRVVDTHISNKEFEIFDADVTPATPCSVNAAGDTVECVFPSLAAGASRRIDIKISEDEPMDINDTATVTSDTADSNTSNNEASDGLHIIGVADLRISKAASAVPGPNFVAGEQVEYVLTVTNDGPSTARNVVVRDVLPAGTSVVNINPAVGYCDAGVPGDPARPVVCPLGNMAPGESVVVEILLNILPDTRGLLFNTASVSSDTLDPNTSNNQASTSSPVIAITNLQLEKRAKPVPVRAGEELVYVLRLKNLGPSTATGVMLDEVLPPYTTVLDVKVLGGTDDCAQGAGQPADIICRVGTLAPGEAFVLNITVLVDPSTPNGIVLENCAQATSDEGGRARDCNYVEVVTEADLWVDKIGGFITQNPGKDIRYTITVHNDKGCSGDDPQVCGDGGPSDAQNVVVYDKLPSTYKKLVVTFVTEDCTYDQATHSVTCITPTLAAGDFVVHEIEATPKGKLGVIRNKVWVQSATYDPNHDWSHPDYDPDDPAWYGNNHDYLDLAVGGGGQKGTGE